MNELSTRISELEKKVKRITRSKQKKYVSTETMEYFKKVLAGIDELNKDVLSYNGTNAFLFAKMNNDAVASNYAQF